MSIALSRMNKKQLYEECKKLRIENMKLTLFQMEARLRTLSEDP